jgi:hypothetical protein
VSSRKQKNNVLSRKTWNSGVKSNSTSSKQEEKRRLKEDEKAAKQAALQLQNDIKSNQSEPKEGIQTYEKKKV